MFDRFAAPARRRLRAAAFTLALVALPLGAGARATAAPATVLAPVSASLSGLLATAADAAPVTVLVHGTSLAAADDAVRAAGLTKITTFKRVGVVVASGTAGQVRAARSVSGVRYLENNDKLQP